MAKRRAVGGALSNAGAQFREIAQLLMRQKIAEEAAIRENERVTERQKALENLRHLNDLSEVGAREDSSIRTERRKLPFTIGESQQNTLPPPSAVLGANRQLEGEPDVAFKGPFPVMDIPGLGPREQVAFPVGREGQSEIELLLRAQAAKQAQFDKANRTAEGYKERMLPGGVKGILGATGEEIPTERTGEQEAERQSAIESGTRDEKKLTEQMLAGVRGTGRQLAGGMNPITGEPQFGVVDVRSGATTPVEGLAPRPQSGGAGAGIDPAQSARSLFDRFKTLSDEINSGAGPEQILTGLGRKGLAFINMDDAMQEFQQLREPLGIMVAVLTQGSRPTDRDAQVLSGLLPGGTTPKPVAKNLLNNMEKMLAESKKRTGVDISQMSQEQIQEMVKKAPEMNRAQFQMFIQQLTQPSRREPGAIQENVPGEAGMQDAMEELKRVLGSGRGRGGGF